MNDKETLTNMLKDTQMNSELANEGIACVLESTKADKEELKTEILKLRQQIEKQNNSAVLDVLADIAIVIIGTIIALVIAGVIYF